MVQQFKLIKGNIIKLFLTSSNNLPTVSYSLISHFKLYAKHFSVKFDILSHFNILLHRTSQIRSYMVWMEQYASQTPLAPSLVKQYEKESDGQMM